MSSAEDILEDIWMIEDQLGSLREVVERCAESFIALVLEELRENPSLNKDQRQLIDEAYKYALELEKTCDKLSEYISVIRLITIDLRQTIQEPSERESSSSS
jgi:hypothetical protein